MRGSLWGFCFQTKTLFCLNHGLPVRGSLRGFCFQEKRSFISKISSLMQGQMDLHQKEKSLGMFGLVQVHFQIYDFCKQCKSEFWLWGCTQLKNPGEFLIWWRSSWPCIKLENPWDFPIWYQKQSTDSEQKKSTPKQEQQQKSTPKQEQHNNKKYTQAGAKTYRFWATKSQIPEKIDNPCQDGDTFLDRASNPWRS